MKDEKFLRVIIADDSDALRLRLSSMFSENSDVGIIGEAKDGQGAMVLIEKLKPDVAIIDVRMPSTSGIEVLQQLKRAGNSPVIIVLTNYPYRQYKEKCLEMGADYFFDKSTEFHKVLEVLEILAQESRAQGRERRDN